MRYDIVLVSYNSEKWVPGCLSALSALQYDLKQLNVVFVDNQSTDGTPALLDAFVAKSPFGGFSVVRAPKNGGFGAGCNLGAATGSAPLLFFLNVDTEIAPDALKKLDEAECAHPEAVGFELCQAPMESYHHIDPVTLQTQQMSGAALVARRAAYEGVGGFDEKIWLYGEDVDLSWRLGGKGPLVYVPNAVVVRHTEDVSASPAALQEYVASLYYDLLLRYKFGHFATVLAGHKKYLNALKYPRHFDGVRRVLAKNYLRHFVDLWHFRFWRWGNRQLFRNCHAVFDPAYVPDRGQEALHMPDAMPRVSVVVRTCARPAVLAETLESLCHQTYPNFEILVVEDGQDTCGEMLRTRFAQLPLRYLPTGTHVGRGRAGNIGIEAADGDLVCFLDDDDYFYPDHILRLVAQFVLHPQVDLVLGSAMAFDNAVQSTDPYVHTKTNIYPIIFDHVTLMDMCVMNRIFMPAAMFRKKLYTAVGGLREDIDGNEDWAMWLRYLTVAKRNDPLHVDVRRATCLFGVPADAADAKKREAYYSTFEDAMLDDPLLQYTVTQQDADAWRETVRADILHLGEVGQLDAFLAQQVQRPEFTPEDAFPCTLSARQIRGWYYALVREFAKMK